MIIIATMDWERKMEVENIIYAYKFGWLTFEQSAIRMKEVFKLYPIKIQNPNYKLN